MYLTKLPHLWLTEQVQEQFLKQHVFHVIQHAYSYTTHTGTDVLKKITEILKQAIVHCNFGFVEALLQKKQILKNLQMNTESSNALLEEVVNALLAAFKNERLRNLPAEQSI